MYNNCVSYNGNTNSYTNTAQRLLNACNQALSMDYGEQLQQLEEAIMASIDEPSNDEDSQFQFKSGSFQNSGPTSFGEAFLNQPGTSTGSGQYLAKRPKMQQERRFMKNEPKSFSDKKQAFFSLAERNSPRSGSDAEVFVDVETVDERGLPLLKRAPMVQDEAEMCREYATEDNEDNEDYAEIVRRYQSDAHLFNEDYNFDN